MADHVCVIGAGAAGTAAAWSARRSGARVTVLDGGAGATSLASGALDRLPWEPLERAARLLAEEPIATPCDSDVTAWFEALGCWTLVAPGERLAHLCTDVGRLRCAAGRDRAVLDFARLPPRARILVPRVERADWSADALVRTLESDRESRARGFEFAVSDVAVLQSEAERRIPTLDLAARHDDVERCAWLARSLADHRRIEPFDAVLLGPWFGTDEPRAEEVSRRAGVPVGETMSPVGGAAGLRFDAARQRLLSKEAIACVPARARAVRRVDLGFIVTTDADALVACDAVVMAMGGLVGGGVVLGSPEPGLVEDEVGWRAPRFRLSFESDVALQCSGRRVDAGGSLQGPTLDASAWPTAHGFGSLEAIGVAAVGVEVAPGLLAAGDAVADRPRTMLEAVASGIRAGRAAASGA